ncbi:MAG TPA: hypothetical protein VEM41_04085 [Actinomycetota bacterium]|nr:hypothetical protein [Actinomycetota bacterium]
MLRPYSQDTFRALERELRGAADHAAKHRDARGDRDRTRGRVSVAIAAGLRSVADRLDARPRGRPDVATEGASGPC